MSIEEDKTAETAYRDTKVEVEEDPHGVTRELTDAEQAELAALEKDKQEHLASHLTSYSSDAEQAAIENAAKGPEDMLTADEAQELILEDFEEAYAEPPRRDLEFAVSDVEGDLDGVGLLFNTFRIGYKWKDAEPLESLNLVLVGGLDGARRTLDGQSVVLSVDHGDLSDMLDKHVGLNHGVKYQREGADKRLALRNVLESAYGRKLFDQDKCVVLYISRII